MRDVRLLLATTNSGKANEIRTLFAGLPFELVTLARWPGLKPPEENGSTFAENARAKAIYYATATGELTLAEDSGLEVDALGGAPGVHSARYGGPDSPYPRKFELLYAALEKAGAPGSPARFACAAALARGSSIVFEACGTVEGRIAPEPRGAGGFGYDPIFFYPPFGVTLAEAGERKQEVSHRAAAMRAVREFLTADATRLNG
jgi:XTP/dITP diphosphohydrolase